MSYLQSLAVGLPAAHLSTTLPRMWPLMQKTKSALIKPWSSSKCAPISSERCQGDTTPVVSKGLKSFIKVIEAWLSFPLFPSICFPLPPPLSQNITQKSNYWSTLGFTKPLPLFPRKIPGSNCLVVQWPLLIVCRLKNGNRQFLSQSYTQNLYRYTLQFVYQNMME